MSKKVEITMKLPQLQNLIKRDPEAYKDEFMMQFRHFQSEYEIFNLRPARDFARFAELISFICHVSGCYKTECENVPTQLLKLLEAHANILDSGLRKDIFQGLMLLRNKGLLEPTILIDMAFKLFRCPDKQLRELLYNYILNDIKNMNEKGRNEKLNKRIQAKLFVVVQEDTTIAAKKAVELLSELYRKRVWTDERTVNVIGAACLAQATRVMVAGVHFFLGIEQKMEDDEDEEGPGLVDVDQHRFSKKTKKRARDTQRQVEKNRKIRREKMNKAPQPLFPAIQLLHDPHNLAEQLFRRLRSSNERFELLMMNFISRLIGCHKLHISSFYSFLQRYLTGHQSEVTHILAFAIQACHELVPPDDVAGLIKAISFNFVSDRCSDEMIAIGINTIREILSRTPALLNEPGMDDFVQDLAMYTKMKHKTITMAARSLINLVRELYPALLRGKDRGKFHQADAKPQAYGELRALDHIDGIEFLEQYERGDIYINSDGEVAWKEDENLPGSDDEQEQDEWEEVEEEEEEEEEDNDDDADGDDDEEEEEDDDDEEDEDNDEEQSDLDEYEEVEDEDADEDADDDSGSGDWEDVSDDDNAPVEPKTSENDEEVPQLVPASAVKPPVSHRVLSTEDFALLHKLKTAAATRMKDPRFRKRAVKVEVPDADEDDEDEDERVQNSFTIDPSELEKFAKRKKLTKAQRIESVLSGRDDFEHKKHAGGLTNKEKSRLKNPVMVTKSRRLRQKMQLAEKVVMAKRKHASNKHLLSHERKKRRRT